MIRIIILFYVLTRDQMISKFRKEITRKGPNYFDFEYWMNDLRKKRKLFNVCIQIKPKILIYLIDIKKIEIITRIEKIEKMRTWTTCWHFWASAVGFDILYESY